jgi:hypothetical protein
MTEHNYMYPKVTPVGPADPSRETNGNGKAPKTPAVRPSAHTQR